MRERVATRAYAPNATQPTPTRVSPTGAVEPTSLTNAYVGETDYVDPGEMPEPTPAPVLPMAQAVQPTGNAMAVASETNLDAPPSRSGGMNLIGAPGIMTSTSGGQATYTPPTSPAPRTTAIAPPAPAPMKPAAFARPKPQNAPGSGVSPAPVADYPPQQAAGQPVSQPSPAPAATNPLSAASMAARAQAIEQEAERLEAELRPREQAFAAADYPENQMQYFVNARARIERMRLEADTLFTRAQSQYLGEQALQMKRAADEREANKPEDTLSGNEKAFADLVRMAGPDTAASRLRQEYQVQNTQATQRDLDNAERLFKRDAFGVVVADLLNSGQRFTKGDTVTRQIATLANQMHPNSGWGASQAVNRSNFVRSIMASAGIKAKLTPNETEILSQHLSQIVEELIAESK